MAMANVDELRYRVAGWTVRGPTASRAWQGLAPDWAHSYTKAQPGHTNILSQASRLYCPLGGRLLRVRRSTNHALGGSPATACKTRPKVVVQFACLVTLPEGRA